MGKDVMQLFGGTVALQNNIVSMMQNFLGGATAANGMLENVFHNGIPHPPTLHPPITYHLSQVLYNMLLVVPTGKIVEVHISHYRFFYFYLYVL